MPLHSCRIEDAVVRMRVEYLEMPGLKLTAGQAERLCGVDRMICETVLGVLVDTHFLRRARDGSYLRADEG
jgi:hypothetical protein